MASAVVVLADGFEEIEAVTPIDLLRRAGVTVAVAGLSGPSAVSARGLRVQCDAALADLVPGFDALVLPGGQPGAQNLGASPLVQEWIGKTLEGGGWVAAICAAPAAVLGAHGWLEGRRFTGYPGSEALVPGGLPSGEAVVVDGRLITSRGVGTAAAFGLKLAEVLAGPETARKVAEAALLA